MRWPRVYFLEAPSPLFLLLFRFVVFSIGVSVVVLAFGFLFAEALVAGSSGCSLCELVLALLQRLAQKLVWKSVPHFSQERQL